jgi:hypothetical protein
MWQHLWTRGPQPAEYLELILCRDIYHCAPPVLATIPLRTVAAHLTCLRVERAVQARRQKGRRRDGR